MISNALLRESLTRAFEPPGIGPLAQVVRDPWRPVAAENFRTHPILELDDGRYWGAIAVDRIPWGEILKDNIRLAVLLR